MARKMKIYYEIPDRGNARRAWIYFRTMAAEPIHMYYSPSRKWAACLPSIGLGLIRTKDLLDWWVRNKKDLMEAK